MKKINLLVALCLLFSLHVFSQGTECDDPYQVDMESEATYDFNEATTHFLFTPNDDNVWVQLSPTNSLTGSGITSLELYEYHDCQNLIAVDTIQIAQDSSQLADSYFNSLSAGTEYLLKVNKAQASNSVQLDMVLISLSSATCQPYNLTCGELMTNGDFSNFLFDPTVTGSGFSHSVPFGQGHVCDWDFGHESPSFDNIATDPAVKMWVKYSVKPPGQTSNKTYGESILKSIPLTQGQSYLISFKIKQFGTFPLPDLFNIKLLHSSDVAAPNGTVERNPLLYELNASQSQDIVSIPESAMNQNGNWQSYTFCFTPNSNYDRMLFYPYENVASTSQDWILLDDISLKKFEIDLGNDIISNMANCENTNQLDIPMTCLPTSSGYSYAWTPSSKLNQANIKNPIATTNPFKTETFTAQVTHTNLLGGTSCTVSDQISIIGNSKVLPSGSDISDLRSQFGIASNVNSLSNESILISGTFNLNEDFTFTNCQFIMDEDAKILQAFGKSLVLDHSEFNTCADGIYWNGIEITGGGNSSLTVQSCQFYNATTAFNFNGSTIDFEIKNCLFDKNKLAIHFNSNGISHNQKALLSVDTFLCSSSLTDKNGNSFYPKIAVLLSNYDFSSTSFQQELVMENNEFYGSAGQLKVFSNATNIQYNIFQGFNNQFSFPGSPLKEEVAVNIKGYTGNTSTEEVNLEGNKFYANKKAIKSRKDLNLILKWNAINNTGNPHFTAVRDIPFSTGIDIANNSLTSLVEENWIHMGMNGLVINNCKNMDIIDNDFNLVRSNPPFNPEDDKYSTAINVNNVNVSSSYTFSYNFDVNIAENNIAHYKNGISTNFAYCSIKENRIVDLNIDQTPNSPCGVLGNPCPAPMSVGIRAINDVVEIRENYITSTSSANNLPDNVGISVENADHPNAIPSRVYCNKVENTGIGLRFMGNCGDYMEILNNEMKSNYRGLVLDQEANIGDVGSVYNEAASNTYTGTYNPLGSDTYNASYWINPNNPLDNANPTHYILAGTGPSILPGHSNPGYSIMTTIIATSNNQVICGPLPLLTQKPSKKQVNTGFNQQKKRGHANSNKWFKKANVADSAFYLYQQLQFHHLNADSSLFKAKKWKHFTDSMKNTVMGKIKRKNNRRNITSLTNFDVILASMDSELAKHELEQDLNAAELNHLQQIALKCPYYDGIAVYMARAILSEYGYPSFSNSCESAIPVSPSVGGTKRLKANTANKLIETEALVYPNPSNGKLNIDYTIAESEVIQIQVHGVDGKLLFNRKLKAGSFNQFDLSNLQPAIYLIRLVKGEEIIKTEKLILYE